MVSSVKFVFYTALILVTLLGLAVLAVALIIINGNASFAAMSPSGDYKIEAVPAFPLFVGWERAYMHFERVSASPIVLRRNYVQ
jgi:hypothetical protein